MKKLLILFTVLLIVAGYTTSRLHAGNCSEQCWWNVGGGLNDDCIEEVTDPLSWCEERTTAHGVRCKGFAFALRWGRGCNTAAQTQN